MELALVKDVRQVLKDVGQVWLAAVIADAGRSGSREGEWPRLRP